MQHSAFVETANIDVGTVILIATKTFAVGDTIALEFPNNNREPAEVTSASAHELVLQIERVAWRLRPRAPSDAQVHTKLPGIETSSWTVQTKL